MTVDVVSKLKRILVWDIFFNVEYIKIKQSIHTYMKMLQSLVLHKYIFNNNIPYIP